MTQNQKRTQPQSGGFFFKYKANFTDTAERKSTDVITKNMKFRTWPIFFFILLTPDLYSEA